MMAFDKPPPTDRPLAKRLPTPVAAHSPQGKDPVTHDELDAFERRVMSEVKAEIEGIKGGIEQRIDRAVETALLRYPGLAKLDQIAKDAETSAKAAAEAADYRARRDERERIERENRDRAAWELAQQKERAQLEQIGATTQNLRTESGTKYRTALLSFLGVVVAALCTLVGAMLASRR